MFNRIKPYLWPAILIFWLGIAIAIHRPSVGVAVATRCDGDFGCYEAYGFPE